MTYPRINHKSLSVAERRYFDKWRKEFRRQIMFDVRNFKKVLVISAMDIKTLSWNLAFLLICELRKDTGRLAK